MQLLGLYDREAASYVQVLALKGAAPFFVGGFSLPVARETFSGDHFFEKNGGTQTMPQNQKPAVENIMGIVGRYSRVPGTTRYACYDREDRLFGYYDVETGEVYDANEKHVGRGFGLLTKLSPGE